MRATLVGAAAGSSRVASAAVAAAYLSAASPPTPVRPRVVDHGSRSASRTVALTFDLCATKDDPETLETRIVSTLRAKEASATFMMGGLWARAHPAWAASLGAEPRFEIGNHSMTHPHLTGLTDARVAREIIHAQRAVGRATGRRALVFRFPFDEYDRRTIGILGACGLVGIAEDLRTGDPDPNISADRLVEYVVGEARPGSIVLMHANGNGVHTAEALPAMIDGLRAGGLRLVTLSEMLGLPAR